MGGPITEPSPVPEPQTIPDPSPMGGPIREPSPVPEYKQKPKTKKRKVFVGYPSVRKPTIPSSSRAIVSEKQINRLLDLPDDTTIPEDPVTSNPTIPNVVKYDSNDKQVTNIMNKFRQGVV